MKDMGGVPTSIVFVDALFASYTILLGNSRL